MKNTVSCKSFINGLSTNLEYLEHGCLESRIQKYLPGNTVDMQFDHVLPTRVVFWLPLPVLRVDDAADK